MKSEEECQVVAQLELSVPVDEVMTGIPVGVFGVRVVLAQVDPSELILPASTCLPVQRHRSHHLRRRIDLVARDRRR